MNQLFTQPYPKTAPRISRQILEVQEKLGQTYELLTEIYQLPGQTFKNSGLAERLISLHVALQEFQRFIEQLHQASTQEEVQLFQDFIPQEHNYPSGDLKELKREARRTKKLTNQLAASFCKIRLGIKDNLAPSIQNDELNQLSNEVNATVFDLFSSLNSDFE